MKTILLALLCLLAIPPQKDYLQNVLLLSGASCLEELSSQQLEHYEQLYDNPLDINSCNLSQLCESELFTELQAALLLDYRKRCGPLLSLVELSAIPGIGREFAFALEPFVTFRALSPSQRKKERRLFLKQQMRLTFKPSSVGSAFKSELSLQPGFRSLLSVNADGIQSFSLCYEGKTLSKLVLGNLNGRFGQGLLLWSGFSLSSLSSSEAFSRKASKISPSNSLSAEGTLRGIGAQLSLGRWSLNALACREMAYFYAGRLAPRSSIGCGLMANADYIGGSADTRSTLGSFTLFAEGALQIPLSLLREGSALMSSALVAGSYYNIGYGTRLALLLRFYAPSYDSRYSGAARAWSKNCDENALSLALDWKGFKMVSDWSVRPLLGKRQWKSQLDYSRDFGLGSCILHSALSFRSRLRSSDDVLPRKYELRCDVGLSKGLWRVDLRLHALRGKALSGLGYLQLSYSADKAILSARASLFAVDNWDDRIYAYARDVPGTFSVPAFYGRGWEFALYARYRNFALRFAKTCYFAGSRNNGYEFKVYMDMQRFFGGRHLI